MVVATGVLICGIASAQPSALYGQLPVNNVGARASAMGGAYVALADDSTGSYWNPAGATWGPSGLPDIEVNIQSTGLPAIQDMINAGQSLANVENFSFSDLDRLFPVAESISGQPVSLSVNPYFGLNTWNVGIHAVAFTTAGFTMTTNRVDPGNAANPNYRNITITTPGALGVAQGGVSYAKGVGEWDVGVTVKTLAGVYAPGGRVSSTATNINDGTTYTLDTSGWGAVVVDQGPHIGVDLGAIKETAPGTRFGIVLRNVNSPTLFTGANLLRIKPSLDLGFVRKPKDNFTICFDLHNLTGANGSATTMHVGLERRIFDVGYLRAGLNNNQTTYGLGLDIGPARLDLAVGSRLITSTTIGFHLEF